MASKIGLVIRREYMERVSKKSFIITTILMPIVMVALMLAPALIMMMSTTDTKTIAVIDDSGAIAQYLEGNEEVHFITPDQPRDSVMADDSLFGVLVIERGILTGNSAAKLYTNAAGSISIESNIKSQIENIIETEKLKAYNIENLDQILDDVRTPITLQTFRNEQGKDESSSSSSAISYAIGVAMTFLLYMFLLLYGQMVMTSIIEEKNNRVLEIVVSSVRPQQLMMGKIIGIGLVAVTQILIWVILMTVISSIVLPALVPADMMSQASAFNAGTIDASTLNADPDLLHAISIFGNVGYILEIFGYLLLFLIGGFLFYSSIYAAIGSAVDNIQDAGQLQSVVVFPIIIGLIFAMTAATDPNSTMALVLSLVPFTSPMVMMVRIPFGIPSWEIITSLVLLYISFIFMVWIAAKIYRVGIFMYGKKPTVRELIRWASYK